MHIITRGLAATSLMTLFSYVVSEYRKRNFREPQLLGDMVKPAVEKKEIAQPAGWGIHYGFGLTWTLVHSFLLKQKGVRPTLRTVLALGVFSGVVAVVSWKLIFSAHPQPPKTDFKRFYGHLIVAHLVFTLVTVKGSGRK